MLPDASGSGRPRVMIVLGFLMICDILLYVAL